MADGAGLALAATATFGITSLVALLMVALAPTLVLGWATTVIESSSMQPTVERGDIVVLRPIDERRADVGAVVRFPADDGGSSIVHRIVEVDLEAGAYVTKGDANRNDDRALVPFDEIDGLGTILVPLVGHPALWYHEGRFVLLALVSLVGAGVIWAGTSAGGRRPGDPDDPSTSPGHPSILVGPPLSRWSIDHPVGINLFPLPAGGHPGRGQPGSP